MNASFQMKTPEISFSISPFDTTYLPQLEKLPPEEWLSNAYELFLHYDWQPWFLAYQCIVNEQLAGFGMLMIFDEFAWFGWILVAPPFRRKGLGTAITQRLIDEATSHGAKGFILTATDMGKPIYEKFGFTVDSNYLAFSLPHNYRSTYKKGTIRRATSNDLEIICNLDLQATGEQRKELIKGRLDDCFVYDDQKIEGFYMPSLGNGFIVACHKEAGITLLNYRCTTDKRAIVVPEQNKDIVEYLRKKHFTEGFAIPRMTLGKRPDWRPSMIFSRAAGYLG